MSAAFPHDALRDEILAAWHWRRVKAISDEEFASVMERTFPPCSISVLQQEQWLARTPAQLADDWPFVTNEFWIQASAGFVAYYLPAMLLAVLKDLAMAGDIESILKARFDGVCGRLEAMPASLSAEQLRCVAKVRHLARLMERKT